MTPEKIEFYLRHRRQISEWAKLEKRADDLMRDAIKEGAQDKATKLLKGDSGDHEVDFYVRNRSLITEWESLQTAAGEALHGALLDAAREAGFVAGVEKRGWTGVLFRSPEFDRLRDEHGINVQLTWTRQHLLSTRRGYPFPRLVLDVSRNKWKGESRDMLAAATRPVAQDLGMKRHDSWWAHWGMLDAIAESQNVRSYADACVVRLQDAAKLFYPVLVTATSATPIRPGLPPADRAAQRVPRRSSDVSSGNTKHAAFAPLISSEQPRGVFSSGPREAAADRGVPQVEAEVRLPVRAGEGIDSIDDSSPLSSGGAPGT